MRGGGQTADGPMINYETVRSAPMSVQGWHNTLSLIHRVAMISCSIDDGKPAGYEL
jgi:hypothetical protein